jgi:hypothetical protein
MEVPLFSAQHLFIIEFDGVDPLVLLADGDILQSDQFKDVLIDLLVGNGGQVPILEVFLKLQEIACVYIDGALTVTFSLELLQVSRRELLPGGWQVGGAGIALG